MKPIPDIQPITTQFTVTLTAVVHPQPFSGGYSAEVPALPGCFTQGETLEEVQSNLREAAEGWLDVAHEDGRIKLAQSEAAA